MHRRCIYWVGMLFHIEEGDNHERVEMLTSIAGMFQLATRSGLHVDYTNGSVRHEITDAQLRQALPLQVIFHSHSP
jgi:UDP-2,3-diacylglucosamine pyrophosphatase LpxH